MSPNGPARDPSPDKVAGWLASLAGLATATIYEAADKRGDVGPTIRPLVAGVRLIGPAFTVKALAGDNRVVFRAIDEAPKGSVLVIDAGGSDQLTIWGGTGTVACLAKGIAGCVTNGAVRDTAQIRSLGFPVYAAGINLRGPTKAHPGWTQIPIAIGGATVNPGDIVIGDEDGILIVARERCGEVAAKAQQRVLMEEDREARLRRGETCKQVIGH